MPNPRELAAILQEVRERVAASDNFIWSSWEDSDDALREIDGMLAILDGGIVPGVTVLFLPTGPLQEVAMGSGWGDEFLQIADRFDRAMAGGCGCFVQPSNDLSVDAEIGLDREHGEVSVNRCPSCGQLWLRYFWELEVVSRSGRWYLGAITPGQCSSLTSENAKEALEAMDWYFYGGSYFDSRVGVGSGSISLNG